MKYYCNYVIIQSKACCWIGPGDEANNLSVASANVTTQISMLTLPPEKVCSGKSRDLGLEFVTRL